MYHCSSQKLSRDVSRDFNPAGHSTHPSLLLVYHVITTTTVLRPFFQDRLGEPAPEENFWTLWCKGRLTEADTQTIRLGATPSGLAIVYHVRPVNIC